MPRPDLVALDRAHVWHPFTQHRLWDRTETLIIERGDGNYLIDVDGNRYLDGVSSLWTNVHGHRHPKIDAAIRAQLDEIAHTTLLGLTHPRAIELAARLAAMTGLPRVFFSDNGSTAAEVAAKMAVQYQQQVGHHGRTRIAGLADAYHGDTLGSVAIGYSETFHKAFRPLLFDAIPLPAPTFAGGDEEADCLERAVDAIHQHGDALACVVVEPLVQGAAGMKMHSPAYLGAVMRAAHDVGALVVADEVAVGFGRTGTMFATDQVGVRPDFLCVAKGLSGGYLPIAATLTTDAVYEAFLGEPTENRQFFHGHTYTGNPLACAAALACLDVFEDEHTLDVVADSDRRLARKLATLAGLPGIRAIRHKGVLVGIDLCAKDGSTLDRARVTGHRAAVAARRHGAILRPLGDTLVLNPPLSLHGSELERLVDIAAAAIAEVT